MLRRPASKLLITTCSVAALAVVAYIFFFSRTPKRPEDVSANAVFVKGSKAGWWQSCVKVGPGAITCRVVSISGQTLLNEEFLPYDGGPLPATADLVLDPDCRYSSAYRICLKNGRILLPRSMYRESKELLDSFDSLKR